MSCDLFEHILPAVLNKTAVVMPLASHRTNHQSKTTKTRWALTRDVLQCTPKYGHTIVGRPVKTYIHQVCTDPRFRLDDYIVAWLVDQLKTEA